MKKRMFLSTILMTLVLLVALTTATFAWYQASAGDYALTENAATGKLNVADNSLAAGKVTVTVTWGEKSSNVNYTDTNGDSYYYNGLVDEAHKVKVASPVATGTAAFTLSLVGNDLDKKAAAGTYTITFTADGEVKIGNSVSAAIAISNSGSTATHTFTIDSNGNISVGSQGSVIFGFMGTDAKQEGASGSITATALAKN